MARDSNPLAVSRFTDNPNSTARRGCLRPANMLDKWRDRSEALRAGNQTRTAIVDQHGSLLNLFRSFSFMFNSRLRSFFSIAVCLHRPWNSR